MNGLQTNAPAEGGPHPTGVFEDLRRVQDAHGFVSEREIELIAGRRGVHVRDVHTVASFYPHFRLKPPVPVDVRVCDDMTCHLYQSHNLRVALENRYATQPKVVRVRDISCVGRCDSWPNPVYRILDASIQKCYHFKKASRGERVTNARNIATPPMSVA